MPREHVFMFDFPLNACNYYILGILVYENNDNEFEYWPGHVRVDNT